MSVHDVVGLRDIQNGWCCPIRACKSGQQTTEPVIPACPLDHELGRLASAVFGHEYIRFERFEAVDSSPRLISRSISETEPTSEAVDWLSRTKILYVPYSIGNAGMSIACHDY